MSSPRGQLDDSPASPREAGRAVPGLDRRGQAEKDAGAGMARHQVIVDPALDRLGRATTAPSCAARSGKVADNPSRTDAERRLAQRLLSVPKASWPS
jgi:hypothetical protein